jgi:hypothetical protein
MKFIRPAVVIFIITIAGVTEGGGVADPGASDLSTGGPFPVSGTTYQQFLGDFDLSNLSVLFQ